MINTVAFLDNQKQNIVKAIAQELDCGFDCYYNSKTHDLIAMPSLSQFADDADFEDAFQEDFDEINKHQSDYIKFEAVENFEFFKIMEQFVDQIIDEKLKAELENVLHNKKPFLNFKQKIDHSNFRQNWFEFKRNQLEKIVKRQLDLGEPRANHRI